MRYCAGGSMRLFSFVLQIAILGLVGCQSVPARHSDTARPRQLSESAEANDTGPAPVAFGTPTATDIAADSTASEIRLAAHQKNELFATPGSVFSPEGLPMPLPGGVLPRAQLTLADLEAMALNQNPSVSEAVARVESLRGNYVQVGLPPNPSVGYVAEDVGDEGTAGKQGGFVGQQLITGNKLSLNRAVAAQQVRRAEQELAAQQQRVLTDVRLSYYDVLIAQERLETADRLVSASRQAVQAVEQLLTIKEVSRTELLQAQIEANTAQMLLDNARAARTGAWQRLTAVLGNPEMPVAEIAGNASTDLPTLEFDASLSRLLAERPELAAVDTGVERARWALSRARAEVVPDLNVQATVQQDDASDLTVAGVQVGLPLPILNRNQGGIQRAQGELVAAQRAVDRRELALYRRLAAVFQQYVTARQQVDRYRLDILPDVDETLRLTTEGYRAGEFNFLQFLIAQRTYFQTNLAYLDALGQMWAASRQIEGLLLSDSLETGPVPE